jgi:succinate dehydrogenase/fumarate reductase cytochrome b subunit
MNDAMLPPGDPAGPWSTRLHRLSGFVVLVWALWFVAQLVALRLDPLWFGRMHDWSGALGARMAGCVVLAALLYHALAGVRIVVLESTGTPGTRLRAWADSAVLFAWFALAIPGMTVVLWPAIEGRLP